GPGDGIGAAAPARDDVLGALDRDYGAQHGAEHVEFSAAEVLAGGGSGTDGTVIFDQQERAVRFLAPFGHIAFGGSQIGTASDPVPQAGAVDQSGFIAGTGLA